MSRWDPEKYLEFETQRTQPAIDLALRVRDKAPLNILDIGHYYMLFEDRLLKQL